MYIEVGAAGEATATELTGKRPKARVEQLMAPQMTPSDKTLPTLSAVLCPFPCVCELVAFQSAQERETLPTILTNILHTIAGPGVPE